ncbi:hypothetical protein LCER1_G009102, partial [Lachnellula cervina]
MAPGPRVSSRPPLTTRIRASFEGKHSKSEITSPTNTNGFVTQDPQAFRAAIDEAIGSESFQNAIANNLARIIKPSIKDALDTLQPLVEAVYSHEVLLRKTNRSVEDLLARIDTGGQSMNSMAQRPETPRSPGSPATSTTPRQRKSSESSNGQDMELFRFSLEKNNKRTVATLAELTNAVATNNKKVTEVKNGIEDIQATLVPTKDGPGSLKSSSNHSNTNTAVMQAQLDQLKADIEHIINAMGSDLGQNVRSIHKQVGAHPSLLASHTTKLDAISTDLVALKGQAGVADKIQSVSADLNSLKSYIEGNTTKQDEMFSDLESQVGDVLTVVEGHTGILAELKDLKDVSPAILEAVQSSNDSHASHATALGELKERSLAPESGSEQASSGVPSSTEALEALKSDIAALKENIQSGLSSHNENLTGIDSKVDNVLTAVEGHKAADQSADILAAVQKSNDSHASHSEALKGIRSLNDTAPTAAPIYDTNFAALEAQILALQNTLHSHTGALDEIKSNNSISSAELVPESENNKFSELEAQIGAITNLLNEIKDDVSAEILTALHDVGQTQASHSTILAEIREADVSDEILTTLHDAHTAQTASLDELKTASSTEPTAEAGNLGVLEAQIGALVSTLDEHKATLAEIRDATSASNDSHASHTASLAEIKSRPEEITPGAVSNLEALDSQIATLSTTLEEHKATLSAIHEGTNASNISHAAHAASLDEIKSRSVDIPVPETDDAGPQIGNIIATLEEQNATLAAIRDTTAASHELHGSHATALSEIKDATTASSGFHTSHAATLAEIKEATSGLSDFHTSHAAALGEIKDAATASSDFNTSHAATLAEIKDVTSGLSDFHTSHTASLGEIKDLTAASNESHAAHAVMLTELIPSGDEVSRSVPDSPDFPALEAHFTNIMSTLEAQNGTLAEIKDATGSPEVLTAVKESHELLSTHTPLLDSIKEGISQEDILSHISELKAAIEESKTGIDAHGELVKDLQNETKSSQSEVAQAIGAFALGGAAGAVASHSEDSNSSEILEEVKAVRAIVEKSSTSIEGTEEKMTSMVSQIDINHTTITTSITTLSDELKAEIDATGTQLTESIGTLSGDVKAVDVSSLGGAIDGCSQEIKNLSTSIETLEGHVKGTGTHLSDGIHLNEKGLAQLKDLKDLSPATVSDRGEVMPEGAWMRSGSPTMSRQVIEAPELSPEEKGYNYLSPVTEEQTPTKEDAPVLDEATEEDIITVSSPAVEKPIPAIEAESVAEEPSPTIKAESIAEEPIPTVEADSVAEEPIPTIEAESVAEEPIPTIEAESVAEEPIPTIEAEVAVEEPEESTEVAPAPEVVSEDIEESAPKHEDIVPEESPIPEVKEAEPEEESPISETKEVEPEENVDPQTKEAAPEDDSAISESKEAIEAEEVPAKAP